MSRSRSAYRVSDTTYVLVRGGASSHGMHLPRGFIRTRRAMRSGIGLGGYRAMQNVEHANLSCGVPLAVRYTADIVNRSGKWSKRLAEPCQRNRITSTGRPRSSQWRRGFNAALLELSSINVIELPCVSCRFKRDRLMLSGVRLNDAFDILRHGAIRKFYVFRKSRIISFLSPQKINLMLQQSFREIFKVED